MLLRDFTPRLYQETIFGTCTLKHCLVVLPTGLGKTGIALMMTAYRLGQYPQSKVVFLAPTKPLAEQHLETFKKHLAIEESKLVLFTGDLSPDKRAELWPTSQVIFSTPQGLENDVLGSKIHLENVSLLIVDEAHRAVGDYSYVFVAQQYLKKAEFPRILALTASPGSEVEHIDEVCKNLGIEAVEVRQPQDSDVAPYVQDVQVEWVKVELPEELKTVQRFLQDCLKTRIETLRKGGLKAGSFVSRKDLLLMQADIRAQMSSGQRDFEAMKTISVLAEAVKVYHALELLETQGIEPLVKYLEKLQQDAVNGKTKAAKNLAQDMNFKSAVLKTQNLYANKIEHPKIAALAKVVAEEFAKNRLAKIIVFTQFRDSAVRLEKELATVAGSFPKVFVGQQKKGGTGLSQKQQGELIDQFKDGLFNVMIATSVAEEGLDIPRVDTVVFYEPIPSAIRQIQRRGRTGRQEQGRVVILMTKATRDEATHWASLRKEKMMHRLVKDMKQAGSLQLKNQHQVQSEPKQTKLSTETDNAATHAPNPTAIKILVDYREKASGVAKELVNLGAELRLEMLQSADYILSNKVGVEFKTVEDFVSSIIDGRLLEQLRSLKENFARPILLIEGTEDLYAVRNIHPNAIRGMLAAIAVSYGIPLLRTKDAQDTAGLLYVIAKREQEGSSADFSAHASKKPVSTTESQEYVVSAFPNVGTQLAKQLLKHFKTIKNFVNASDEDLQKVEGVGEKKAKGIKEVNETEYK